MQLIQQHFLQAVLQQDINSILTHLDSHHSSFPSQQRLAIYRSNYQASLYKALRYIYPVCEIITGEAFFKATAYQYIAKHSANSPDLGEYGQQFAEFLQSFPPAQILPYLPDSARLEWACYQAHRLPESPPFDLNQLTAVASDDYEKLIFQLPANAQLFTSAYPVHKIWQECTEQGTLHCNINLDEGGVKLIIYCRKDGLILDPVTDGQYRLLLAIQQGLPLGILCKQASHQDDFPDPRQVLPELITRGWISNFKISDYT